MFYADSLGFLGGRGGPIAVEKGLKLNLVHLTAVPPWITTMAETLIEIEKFKKMILDQPRLKLVTNQKELSSAIAEGKVAVVLGMQNTPVDLVGGGNYKHFTELKNAGINIIAPCYNKENTLGSGWLNADISLTNQGKVFLESCFINKMIVDLSHCGQAMSRDIISRIKSRRKNEELGDTHLISSHSGCYSQYHHFRNLPDDVLKAVAEFGGVVGISTLTFTNHETDNSIFPFKDHLNRAINLCGAESVCIGSDDLYVTRDEEQARKEFGEMSKKLDPLGTQGARFPENPLSIMGPDMLEKLHKFCLPYFPTKLIDNVFGQNLLRFFERALPAE